MKLSIPFRLLRSIDSVRASSDPFPAETHYNTAKWYNCALARTQAFVQLLGKQ
jgi:hypothetical protein